MRVAEALASARQRLRAAQIASPEHDAEALLAEQLGVARTALRPDEPLQPADAQAFDRLVERRASHEPLQHIVGRAAFRHVEVEVGPGVFVPRPETEVLVGWAVERLAELSRASDRAPVAVDLCTGSGVIALSLASELPRVRVHAVELSEDAHRYAQRNLSATGVELHLGDVAEALTELDGRVDVVVSNPPYVPLDAYESVEVEVRDFDPPVALWSGADGLQMIRAVEATAARLLRPGGWVGCEHSDNQGPAVTGVFAGTGAWSDVRDHEDLAGRSRFVTARRGPS
jgi:release factor glutamine methyltransferase